ncbi:hypothetical protein ABZ260_48465 [Streptosporangium sp. NPDC006013]|uniref:hypothetical protein n=1 Tax=Streptosporangium sp. NPDC006013 TaxID=3155596 RepID=UPI0033B7C911
MPELAPDITAEELDKEIREELRSLPLDLAELISRHLVAAERALGEGDAERAYEHTKVARRFAARIGVIREAVGIAAYHAGHFSEALSDLRAARRMTGSDSFLPIMADCERGLGRPERALDLVRSKEAERLDRVGKIELAIVESGARRDLGQNDAAVITLQRLPELRDTRPQPWSARLAFAYADALFEAGHEGPATEWFGRAMAFDEDGETDAAERYAELTGAVIEDLEEDDEFEDEEAVDGDRFLDDADDDADDEIDADDVIDEVDIDDAATLDADIEDEDDLYEEAFGTGKPVIGDALDNGAPDANGTAGIERKIQEKEGKADLAVEPAFIEPDFGDILRDAPDIHDDRDEADEQGQNRRSKPEEK